MKVGAPILWCLAAAALFGVSPPAAKVLLRAVDPFVLAGLLYLGAAAFVAPLSARGGGSIARRRDARQWGLLVGAVVAGGVAGPVLLLFALRVARSASVSLWLNLEAVATAALAVAFFRENLGWRTWAAAAAVVGGGALLAAPDGFAAVVPAALVAAACVCWALDNNLTALIDGLTPSQSTLVKGVVAGATNLAIGVASGAALPDGDVAAAAMLVGALGYGLSIVLYIAGAQQLGATRAQLAFATAPIAGLAVAWTALGEPILPVQLGAAALMAVGVVLIATGQHVHEHAHDAMVHSHSHRHDDGHHTHVHPGLPASLRHTHEHGHDAVVHAHDHVPDLHHRHGHRG